MKALGFSVVLLFLSQGFAHSQNQIDCRKLWDLEKELGCFAYHPGSGAQTPTEPEKKEFVLESQFGPTTCKASNTIEAAKKDLKKECDGWLKERKEDLGAKYRTGTCNAKCDPCSAGLEKCITTGLVHYSDQ